MTNTQRARDLAEKLDLRRPVKGFGSPQSHETLIADRNAANTKLIATALDAAWQDGVESAARVVEQGQETFSTGSLPEGRYLSARRVGNLSGLAYAEAIRALLPPVTAPGHTDLMVAPESIDTFMEANPLPPDPVGALARLFAHGWQNAHLDFDKAHKLGLLTCVGVGRYIISDMGSAAIALSRRGDNK